MTVDKQVARLTGIVTEYFKGVNKNNFEIHARNWQRYEELLAEVEQIMGRLSEIVDDPRIKEFVMDFVDDVIHEYAENGSFQKVLSQFKEYIRDTVEEFANENQIVVDVTNVVESILNGVDVRQTILFDGSKKVKLH